MNSPEGNVPSWLHKAEHDLDHYFAVSARYPDDVYEPG
jgi:hypothetical protein